MRSTKKFLLVALLIVAAVSMFAFGAVAQAAAGDRTSSVYGATVTLVDEIGDITTTLTPNGTDEWNLKISALVDNASTPANVGTDDGDEAHFDVYLSQTDKYSYKIGEVKVGYTLSTTSWATDATSDLGFDGIDTGKVFADGSYFVDVYPKGTYSSDGSRRVARIAVNILPLDAVLANFAVSPTSYTQAQVTPANVTATITAGAYTVSEFELSVTNVSGTSDETYLWDIMYSSATEKTLAMRSGRNGTTAEKKVYVSPSYATLVLKTGSGVATTLDAGIKKITNEKSATLNFTATASSDITVVADTYGNGAARTITPLNRLGNSVYEYVDIKVTNNLTKSITAKVYANAKGYAGNTSAELLIASLDLSANGGTDKVRFYGLLNKKALLPGDYEIYVKATDSSGSTMTVDNETRSFYINAITSPITSSNVSFSPATYTPGSGKLTLTVKSDDLLAITGTTVNNVESVSGTNETSAWTIADTSPFSVAACTLVNKDASTGTKTASVKVTYNVLDAQTSGTPTTKKVADLSAVIPNATVPVDFKVGDAVSSITLVANPVDTVNEKIIPGESGKELYWKLTANEAAIACTIDLIPYGATADDRVMGWTWTSTSSTLSKEVTWDCVMATYPERKTVAPGLYTLVATGYKQSISGGQVVTTKLEVEEIDIAIGTVVNPTGIAFTPNTASIGKGLTLDASKLLVFTPADSTSQSTNKSKVTYSSDKPSVAYVDPDTGVVTAATIGTAVITAKSSISFPALTATLTVTVEEPATKVTLPAQIRKPVGEKETIKAEFDGPAYPLTFASSDEKVATVDKDGVVTIVAESILSDGVVIKVTCEALKFEQEIPVIGAVKATGLNILPGEEVTIPLGVQPVAKKVAGYIEPKNAVENVAGAVKYASSDESIVFVKENGEVIGLSAGEAVITVSGAGFEKKITVIVK